MYLLLQKIYKNQYFLVFIVLTIIFCGYVTPTATATGDSTQVELVVVGCNNNLICESHSGEDLVSCPADCTPATPATSTPSVGSGGGGNGGSILYGSGGLFSADNFVVNTTIDSATLSWKTNIPVSSTIIWGATLDYETGVISESVISLSHQVKFTSLFSGKRYYYKIDFRDNFGRKVGQVTSFFSTNILSTPVSLVNPKIISVVSSNEKVLVKWKNPKTTDFENVRITRSTHSYPKDPLEGKIIYEGDADSIVDSEIQKGFNYYYTIFARDKKGNYSSGSIFYVNTSNAGEKPSTTISPLSKTEPQIQKLSILDFIFIQDGVRLVPVNGVFDVNGSKALTVYLPYEALPEILKTIVFDVTDPENPDQIASFLLTVNDSKTSYEATIGAFERFGSATFSVQILDYNNMLLYGTNGDLFVYGKSQESFFDGSVIKSLNQAITDVFSTSRILLFLALLICVYFIIKAFFVS